MTDRPAEPAVTEALAAEHGMTPEEWQTACRILGRTPSLTELGHLLGHVVGALLLQVLKEVA